jgi:hypothetical protein
MLNRKTLVVSVVVFFILLVGIFGTYFLFKNNKKEIALSSISLLNKVSRFLPIQEDEKKELEVVNKLVEAFSKSDNIERRFLILLQNNMELRPGGGFLGQYAVLKIKNGNVVSTFVEDANLLDQRITAKVAAPYPFKRMMSIKKWKFRDSNFSPDFAVNVEKAKYFLRLAGQSSNFDGVIAVNTDVFNDILGLTGPITVPGYATEFTSKDGAFKLEETIEKPYLQNSELDTQNRKAILKKMAPLIIDKLFKLSNISKLAEFAHTELKNRNIMLNFTDAELQKAVEEVHWDGKVATDWGSDYLLVVDANMGSLKSDYYIDREISYDVDLTLERPEVTLNILYKHTASYGNWMTSDYHSYLRIYVPEGSELIGQEMVSYPNKGTEFKKSYFGFLAHTLIGKETNAKIRYKLPENFDKNNYRLLIQKQSGVGSVPVKVHVKSAEGDFNQTETLNNSLKFEFQKQ